ncbi:hypothetical protein SPWS13_2911 [Shewanella putrefaciens]|nr:hypothetical protein SPWS13_2911 [Shewanella putrefaciens]
MLIDKFSIASELTQFVYSSLKVFKKVRSIHPFILQRNRYQSKHRTKILQIKVNNQSKVSLKE